MSSPNQIRMPAVETEFLDIPGTQLTVSRVALGTWAMGGWMWGGTDRRESVATIRAAVDQGINLIDTAPVYGFGVSEEIVGEALEGIRGRVVIATKTGLEWRDGQVYRNAPSNLGRVSMSTQKANGELFSSGDLLHRGFIGAGGVLLIAAFGTDWIYCQTALWQWANFSSWLITGSLIVTLVGALLLLIDFASRRAGRIKPGTFILVAAASLLSLVNAFVHSRDAWTSVVPQGILLSAASTILLLIAGAQGWSLATSRPTADRP